MSKVIALIAISAFTLISCGRSSGKISYSGSSDNSQKNMALSEVPESLKKNIKEGDFFHKMKDGTIVKFELISVDFSEAVAVDYETADDSKGIIHRQMRWDQNFWIYSSQIQKVNSSQQCRLQRPISPESYQTMRSLVDKFKIYATSYFDSKGQAIDPPEQEDVEFQVLVFHFDDGSHLVFSKDSPYTEWLDRDLVQFLESRISFMLEGSRNCEIQNQ